MLTFHLQNQISGGGVVDKAVWGDAPEVFLVVLLWRDTCTASCDDHTATRTETTILQQLKTHTNEFIVSSWTFRIFFQSWLVWLNSCTFYKLSNAM